VTGLRAPLGDPDAVKVVAMIGSGLIGAGWTAFFLAKGLQVRAYDPDPAAFARMSTSIAAVWPAMQRAGLAGEGAPPPFIACESVEAACAGAGFIQENGPENLETKRLLMQQIDAAADPGAVIASSTSSLLPSDFQSLAERPDRIIAAHPFNPPSLLPLVEVVGGVLTAPEAVDWAMAFFIRLGKRPIRVRREVPGYVANRMTAALYREAVDLVASGVASVEDVDAAIANGPGLRWAVMGPHLLYHLGGGSGGYRGYLDHLGPAQERRWDTLRTAPLTEPLKAALVAGVEAEIAAMGDVDLEGFRDHVMAELLAVLAKARS